MSGWHTAADSHWLQDTLLSWRSLREYRQEQKQHQHHWVTYAGPAALYVQSTRTTETHEELASVQYSTFTRFCRVVYTSSGDGHNRDIFAKIFAPPVLKTCYSIYLSRGMGSWVDMYAKYIKFKGSWPWNNLTQSVLSSIRRCSVSVFKRELRKYNVEWLGRCNIVFVEC